MNKINQRERTAIIQSLSAGVVPAIGLPHIQVGRKDEVSAIIEDLQRVASGCSTIRFVCGRFGSGKTFFLNLMRAVALERKFVVVQADITTERRLHGTSGQARSLYSELVRNVATRAKPEGGALGSIVERWVGDQEHTIRAGGGSEQDVKAALTIALRPLQELVSGFDFSIVLTRYYEGYLTQNDQLLDNALRWLRAEYTTKTEAREALGVRTIIDDESFYDYLKLFGAFVRIAGYSGLLISIDELVVLSHRLNSTQARNNNYEAILRILNDSLQGQTQGLSWLFAGTDECIEDRRRGFFSYEALATRLAPNRFAVGGHKDLAGPILKLESLTPEECFVLLMNIRNVFAEYDASRYLIPDEAIGEYLKNCQQRMGAAYFQTPRDTVKDFCGLLKVIEQDSKADWRQLLGALASTPVAPSSPLPVETGDAASGDDLTSFRL